MSETKSTSSELPIILFATPDEWRAWLHENHATLPGLWLRLAKKGSGIPSIDYVQAVEGALCYGWIDGQAKKYDETTWIQRFTPRGRKSIWSKINVGRVAVLTESGLMHPAGLAAVEAAQKDGRWEAAYGSPKNITVPEDLQAALDANPEAAAFFATLSGSNRYAILFRIQQAKRPETRAKRIADYVAKLERHEKVYP